MSILAQPDDWALVRRYLRIEGYGGQPLRGGVRWRFEITDPQDGAIKRRLAAIQTPCATCGRVLHPVRPRDGRQRWYYAVACEQDRQFRCSRNRKASREYERIRSAYKRWRDGLPAAPPEPQGTLF